MSVDVAIERINASRIRVLTDDLGIITDIYEYFKYQEPTFQKNRFTKWDGAVRLFNKVNQTLPYGLLQILLSLLNDRRLTYSVTGDIKQDIVKLERPDFTEWVDSLNLSNDTGEPLVPYDFQYEATYLGIRYSRLTILAATSAGKSLILYLLCRYYQEYKQAEGSTGKTLIVVPNITLVSQLARNFEEFSVINKWDANTNIHKIAEGASRMSKKPIFISTWQSLQNMDPEYFGLFSEVFVDECHLASGKSISAVCDASINANVRIGLTGTLKDTALHPLQVQGNFGPIKRVVTTKQLQDRGLASQTKVTRLILQYTTEERLLVASMNYRDEIDFLINHPGRNSVIKALSRSLKGNTLVLFSRKDKHQLIIEEQLLAIQDPSRKYLVINGDVSGDDREDITKLMDRETGITLLGSYVTMQAGVSIKNLHNLVFGHPSKSVIQILQSIGRMLRLHKSKTCAHIIDIVDDLSYRGNANTTLEHAQVRMGYYENEQHPVEDKTLFSKNGVFNSVR